MDEEAYVGTLEDDFGFTPGMPLWQKVASQAIRFDLMLYAFSLVFFSLTIVFSVIDNRVNVRPFYVNDASLWYEHSEEPLVPVWMLFSIGMTQVSVMAAVELLVSLYLFASVHKNFRAALFKSLLSAARLGLASLSALAITCSCTALIKVFVGRLRPDFGHRCLGPDYAAFPRETYDQRVIWDNSECLNEMEGNSLFGSLEFDARKSFVSGHASESFAPAVFVTLFCIVRAATLYNWNPAEEESSDEGAPVTSKPITFLTTLLAGNLHRLMAQGLLFYALPSVMVAAWVACTRIIDNRHHPADVVGGACLGSLIAVLVFGLVYPSIHKDFYATYMGREGRSTSRKVVVSDPPL